MNLYIHNKIEENFEFPKNKKKFERINKIS